MQEFTHSDIICEISGEKARKQIITLKKLGLKAESIFAKYYNLNGDPFGELMIDGIKVEIMGDIQKRIKDGSWENPVDLEYHKRVVEIEGMQIPVLSLEYEYQAYLKLGKIDKAEMLRNWLHNEYGSSGSTSPNNG